MMNENAISNILIDVDFLEDELKRIGRSHLATAFTELRLVSYMIPEIVRDYDIEHVTDNIHCTRRYCSRISGTCQQAYVICTCEAQTITSSSPEVSSIWSKPTRCSFKRVGRKKTEGGRGSWSIIPWLKVVDVIRTP